jgi:acyl-CoA dehydrogenase
MIQQMAERLFAEIARNDAVYTRNADWLSESWRRLEELGLPLALVSEDRGGSAVDPAEALTLVRLAGRFALPLPLAETMAANWLLSQSGLHPAVGIATLTCDAESLSFTRAQEHWRLSGIARRVPWGRQSSMVVVLVGVPGAGQVVRVPTVGLRIEPGQNLAEEPRDDVHFDVDVDADSVAIMPREWKPGHGRRLGAALRAIAMAGALDRVLEMSVAYAGERVQFGKPIGRFQAIQQNLAVLAGHVAAASAAADSAAQAAAGCQMLPVATAKVRVGEAAGAVAAIAHQVHGAMGFTREHGLHHLTRRLWSWRDEFGDETEWSLLIGRHVAEAGPEQLWPSITAAQGPSIDARH